MKTNHKNVLGLDLVICTALLGALTGCVGYVDGPRQEGVYLEPPSVRVEAGFAVQDDYVYYPGYQVLITAAAGINTLTKAAPGFRGRHRVVSRLMCCLHHLQ